MMSRLAVLFAFTVSCLLAQAQQLQLSVGGSSYVPGQRIDFGLVPTAAPKAVTFRLTNNGTASAVLTRIVVDGTAFSLSSNPAGTGLSGGQSVDFTITFAPPAAGPARLGQLWIQAATPVLQPWAEYDLVGTGTGPAIAHSAPVRAATPTPTPAPVLPRATIVAQPAPANGQQSVISIQFDSQLPSSGAGLLCLSNATGAGDSLRGLIPPDDPNGTLVREVSFQFLAGQKTAVFAGHSGIVFQSGTTASTLTFVASLNDGVACSGTRIASQSFTIAPAAVGIDRVALQRASGSVTVITLGLDNTRTASAVVFTFFDTAGHQIGGEIPVDASTAFQGYFAHSGTGLFGLTQSFNVTGDVNTIGSASVKVTNSVGPSATVVSQ